jgi:uncharacterized protein with FMN-binding domain
MASPMRRAPIVIGGTVVGLVGVLMFHSRPAPLKLSGLGGAATTPGPAVSASPAGTPQAQNSPGAGSSPRPASAAQQRRGTRTGVGPGVNYNYGTLAVRVTISGRRILRVGIASIDDGGNSRSQYIDQQSIPLLEHEVMQAQSANIQGVSGASYTSAGFVQSLQAALHALGVK